MWKYLLQAVLLIQGIAAQAAPPMPKSALFSQVVCPSATGSRKNQITLYDKDHNSLGVLVEDCSVLSTTPCKIEGFSDITIGPYKVKHPDAIFGPCKYTDLKIEISATEGSGTQIVNLFATCELVPFPCDGTSPDLGHISRVMMRDLPANYTSVDLQTHNAEGCPDLRAAHEFPDTYECQTFSYTDVTHVKVLPTPDMPSDCNITLYDDEKCASTTFMGIGPIVPGTDLGLCIGPIQDLNGQQFKAKAARLRC